MTRRFLLSLNPGNLNILDPSDAFLEGEQITYHKAGRLFFRDEDHLNIYGASRAKAVFQPVVP